MQRVRIRYTKEGRARYLSARDLTSVWERALRRADLPIAYSEGFHPHAKVSFPDALPVGVASTGDYAELTFAAPIDPGPALARLSAQLPGGMDITTYLDVPDGAPKLARMLDATLWELLWPDASDVAARAFVQELERRADALLAADSVEVVKHRPSGDRTLDVRPAVIALLASLRPSDTDDAVVTPVLRAVLRNAGSTVRPNDLITAMSSPTLPDPGTELPEPRLARRVAQGEPVDGGLREALTGSLEPLGTDVAAEAA